MRINSELILEFEDDDREFKSSDGSTPTISLRHANKLLRDEMSKWPIHTVYGHQWRKTPAQPIKQETAAEVLRDLRVSIINRYAVEHMSDELKRDLERARKALK